MTMPESIRHVGTWLRERQRRARLFVSGNRRRVETWVLVGLLVFSVAQSAYFNHVDSERQKAEQDQVEDIGTASDKATGAAREAKAQGKRNSKIISCLTEYAVTATLALGSQGDWVRTFRTLVATPPAGGPDVARKRFLKATAVHLRTLKEVRDVDLGECLEKIKGTKARQVVFVLASATTERRRGTCLGRPVTIHGTKGSDIISGTHKADVIRTGKGVDLVAAGGGKDRICSGKAPDFINAGKGFDRVNCGYGLDTAQREERRRNCEF